MGILEHKKFVKAFSRLNQQARAILNEYERTHDPDAKAELWQQLNEIQERLTEYNKIAALTMGEDETSPLDVVTIAKAQMTWDNIRSHLRLAKFNDEGIELPEIDMSQLFRGKEYATWQDINAHIKEIIDHWSPPVS